MTEGAVDAIEALPRARPGDHHWRPDRLRARRGIRVLRAILSRCRCRSISCRAITTGATELFAVFGVDGYLSRDVPPLRVDDYGAPDRPRYGGPGPGPRRDVRSAWPGLRAGWPSGKSADADLHASSAVRYRPGRHGRINCRNGASMAGVLRRVHNIERVVCGHHHRPITVRWGGTIGSVAASTAHQVTLDLVPDGSPSTFIMEPPGFHLHVWSKEAGLVTHGVHDRPVRGPVPLPARRRLSRAPRRPRRPDARSKHRLSHILPR